MNKLDFILSQWTKLGAMFNVEPALDTPDIEKLIISTAGVAPKHARLLPMAISWLAQLESLVCRHRLACCAKDIRSNEQAAILGYMLSCVKSASGTSHFNLAIKECKPLSKSQPLYDMDRKNQKLARLAEQFSSKQAKQWGLWSQEQRLYDDAIRPASWIMQNNPSLQYRAFFSGKLQASIITTLQADPSAGESESALARQCNATRKAIRDALDHLELCRLVQRRYDKGLVSAELTSSKPTAIAAGWRAARM